MKTALIVIGVVVLMVIGGWITFNNTGDKATVTIETQEIKKDTEEAVEKGKELIDKAAARTKEAVKEHKSGD